MGTRSVVWWWYTARVSKTQDQKLADAFARFGCCYLTGHGILDALSKRMLQSDESFCALPDETKAAIPVVQDRGFTRGYIGVGKESGSAERIEVKEAFSYGYEWPEGKPEPFATGLQGPNVWPKAEACPGDQVRAATVPIPTKVESSASEDDTNQGSSTDNGETSSEPALASSAAIHLATLEFLQGAYGQGSTVYRKTWHSYFFVLLVCKGSLGMFASQAEHLAGSEPPAAVFKLSGYTLRIRSQPKRPHQFRLTHSSKGGGSPKKPLHFAASSLDEMNGWIAALIKAIAVIDERERVAAEERLNKQTESESATQE
ncbi:hypothetical protein PHYSODRAFT_249719 [Phytophthora sojae]|uniref:PH domain-containing protein n=1 Tax=Phytophthora sojae (strain P6497) TaxID=1094619 RepID=G4ZPL0_PHYSP|nr:hypothetical protein PHYSODRAFT_249719 [Phytophthora sojae]EGZ16322.1 hypothetical protein PHYSODRAFT_249719 [Phytophthora sojae]|eukprot:XP_009530071.1 hypothetical protein PHYSODRAFT_249719 [Phytophthora sojae]